MAEINESQTNKELFKNTGIIAIGQISTKVVNFFLLPLYTALLSQEDYGIIDYITTIASLIAVIVGLQIGQAVFRFLITNRNQKDRIEGICSTSFFLTLCAAVMFLIVYWIISPLLKLQYSGFLAIYVVSIISLQTMSGFVRGLGHNGLYSFANFVAALVTLVLNVVLVAGFRKGVAAMLFAYTVGPFIGSFYLFFKSRIYRTIKISSFSRDEAKTILTYSLPLIPNDLSWSLIHASDRMVILNFLGAAANGLIAVASKFSTIYTTAFSIFNASWTEQVVLHFHDDGGGNYIAKMFDKVVVFFACIAIGIIAVMPIAFPILVNSKFNEAYQLVPFYMIAVFFNAVVGMISAVYLINNETGKVAISTAVAAGINILVDLLCVKYIGIFAAPISSICGYATISIWRIVDVNKRYFKVGIKFNRLILIFFMLFISLFSYYKNSITITLVIIAIDLALAILLNYQIFDYIKSVVTNRRKGKL